MRLEARSTGFLYVATMADCMLDLVDLGWALEMPDRTNTFSYSSADNQLMVVMSRRIVDGEVYDVPQVGWAGTLVLLPPTSGF